MRQGVRPSVCPVYRPLQQRAAAGLPLSAGGQEISTDCCRVPSSSGAAARRLAANAGSVTLTADVGS